MSHGFWGAGSEGRIGGMYREEVACGVSVWVCMWLDGQDCVTLLPPPSTGY
jgi:hypothetical protein